MYRVVLTLAIAGIVVDVTGLFGWRISTTAVGLLGIIATLPLLERLRKLRVGNLEAELGDLAGRVGDVEHRVVDLSVSASEPETPFALPLLTWSWQAWDVVHDQQPSPGNLDRIVWVDDAPHRTRLERNELSQRFDVIQVSDTASGVREVEKSPESTMVITDAVRREGAQVNHRAALELIELLRHRFPYVPVYVYCGPGSIEIQGDELNERARLATSSWTALARQLRSDARAAFETSVAEIVRRVADETKQQTSGGIDFVATIGDETIGIEAKDWRRPPNKSAFQTTVDGIATALSAERIDRGLLVLPRDVLYPSLREQLPSKISATTPDNLQEQLRRTD